MKKKTTSKKKALNPRGKQKEVTAESFVRMAEDADARAASLRSINATQPKPDPDMLVTAHACDIFADIHRVEAVKLRAMRCSSNSCSIPMLQSRLLGRSLKQ